MFESEFLTNSPECRAAYQQWMVKTVELLCQGLPEQPYSGKTAASLDEPLAGEILPSTSFEIEDCLQQLGRVISDSVVVSHPNTIAHLHCPALIPALAAEVVISALNQSMDSFDQAR